MSKLDLLRQQREARFALEAKAVPKAGKVFDMHRGQVAGKLVGPPAGQNPQARADEGRPRAKVGRPRIGNRDKTLAATKPWEALGMSERTWYRRQREKRG